MAHAHAHDGHDHDHVMELSRTNKRRLLFVVVLGSVILVTQVIGGLLANSLVLLSDAAHMSTDIGAVLLAYAAAHFATRPATSSKSYGYARAEIVAAFVNALALWVVSAYFVWESFHRLREPQDVRAGIVLGVGVVSLAVNILLAVVLHRGSGHNLNVRSAYVHILSDVLGSAAAIVAGLGIYFFDAVWLDPVTTLFISVLIVIWTWRLTRETLHILLEGTPHAISSEEVKQSIAAVGGVRDVHDLHVWTLTTGKDNLSAHVVLDDPTAGPDVVRQIRARLKDAHGIAHVTIEVEGPDSVCEKCD